MAAAKKAATKTASRPPRASAPPPTQPVWEPAPPQAHAGWQAMPSAAPPPAQPMDERAYALLLHLSALGGLIVGGLFFLGPLILWLVRKDRSPFIDHEGREATNFHLSMLLYLVAGFVVFMAITVATFGLGALLMMPLMFLGLGAWIVLSVVYPIVNGVKANQGQPSRYPLSIRFIRPPGPAPAFVAQ